VRRNFKKRAHISFAIEYSYAQSIKCKQLRKENVQFISYLYLFTTKLTLAIFFHIFTEKNKVGFFLSHIQIKWGWLSNASARKSALQVFGHAARPHFCISCTKSLLTSKFER